MAETRTYTNIPIVDKILNGERIDTFTVSVGLNWDTIIKPLLVILLGVVVAVAVAKVL